MKVAFVRNRDCAILESGSTEHLVRCIRPYFDAVVLVARENTAVIFKPSLLQLVDNLMPANNKSHNEIFSKSHVYDMEFELCSEIALIDDTALGPSSDFRRYIDVGRSLETNIWFSKDKGSIDGDKFAFYISINRSFSGYDRATFVATLPIIKNFLEGGECIFNPEDYAVRIFRPSFGGNGRIDFVPSETEKFYYEAKENPSDPAVFVSLAWVIQSCQSKLPERLTKLSHFLHIYDRQIVIARLAASLSAAAFSEVYSQIKDV